jgi:hypothetical protein
LVIDSEIDYKNLVSLKYLQFNSDCISDLKYLTELQQVRVKGYHINWDRFDKDFEDLTIIFTKQIWFKFDYLNDLIKYILSIEPKYKDDNYVIF